MNLEKLTILIQSLNIPDVIKRDLIQNIQNIDTNELLDILEKYWVSIKNIVQKDKQIFFEYLKSTNNFFEIKEKENIKNVDLDVI